MLLTHLPHLPFAAGNGADLDRPERAELYRECARLPPAAAPAAPVATDESREGQGLIERIVLSELMRCCGMQ